MSVKPYDNDQTKKEQVREMFDNIAPRYDLINHTLSGNIDRLWRRRVVKIVQGFKPDRVVDIATGTGDLAIAMARAINGVRILGVDLSEGMLEVARRKVAQAGLEDRIMLEQGDAEQLSMVEGSIDVATVAFGVRNFGDLEGGLRQIARTIKPGGKVVILEFSQPKNKIFRAVYNWYSRRILPLIGGVISRDRKAYEYLPESVSQFPKPKNFISIMERAGFSHCKAKSQSFGIAQIYIGKR